MNTTRLVSIAFVAVLLALSVGALPATSYADAGTGFTPQVPVSALGIPSVWIDPSKLHLTSTIMVGSGGWGSRGTSALQVTSLSYSFKAPLWMSVSLGQNLLSPGARNGSSFFLEGFSMAYRPSPNMQFQVQFKDFRSPLQRGYGYGFGGGMIP